jgi:hypothetical protein
VRVEGLGLSVRGSGLMVKSKVIRAQSVGFGVWDLKSRV